MTDRAVQGSVSETFRVRKNIRSPLRFPLDALIKRIIDFGTVNIRARRSLPPLRLSWSAKSGPPGGRDRCPRQTRSILVNERCPAGFNWVPAPVFVPGTWLTPSGTWLTLFLGSRRPCSLANSRVTLVTGEAEAALLGSNPRGITGENSLR